MNIKSLFSSVMLPIEPKAKVTASSNDVKAQESTERDGDGRRQEADQELKRNLSQEEILEAMEKIRKLPGVINNNLRVRLIEEDGLKRVVIEDAEGKIVRRLSEAQLWASVQHLDKATGTIFDKAM